MLEMFQKGKIEDVGRVGKELDIGGKFGKGENNGTQWHQVASFDRDEELGRIDYV